jgi:macrodomain Ter protein organizer (MatP/YcbG family)
VIGKLSPVCCAEAGDSGDFVNKPISRQQMIRAIKKRLLNHAEHFHTARSRLMLLHIFWQMFIVKWQSMVRTMQNPCEGVESIAEMIARLVCDYEARQAAAGQKKSVKSAALPLPLSLHRQPRK